MGHCYSLDLRVRVADFVDAGHSCRAAAQHFDVSESFAIKLVQRKRRFGSPAPARQGLSSDTQIYEIRRHPVLRRLKRELAGEPPPDPGGDSCVP